MLFGQNGEAAMRHSRRKLKSQGFLAASVHGVAKPAAVVRIDCERVPRAADRNVKLLAFDQFRRQARVDVDDDAIDGRALRGVRSRCVPVIDVAETVGRNAQLFAVVQAQNAAARVDGFDCGEIAVGNAQCAVGGAELYAVAS